MIELNNKHYPSEVRSSQAAQLETQETPAGSSDFPGLSESLGLGRKIIAGQTIETGDFPSDLASFKSPLQHLDTAFEGEEYDGELPNPAGSGAPLHRPATPTPHLEAENLPLGHDEKTAALALLEELRTDFPSARVLRFVRYPDDKRIIVVFSDGTDELQIQQRYA